ncbi:MAG: ribonuclease III [Rickettsiales bacterium]|jgi:ribonuclease-3|nr:ribonuclease III [Rickettsiales bacterium]
MASVLGYEFKDEKLLERALTQSGADGADNNERLEFLGDRVLGLAAAELLGEMFPAEPEGALAQRHASLVSTATLGKIAEDLGLFPKIRHSHLTAGNKTGVLADGFEAVLGAIYTDGGWDAARGIVRGILRPVAAEFAAPPKDAKTTLQELCQKNFGTLPVYVFMEESGPSHNPVFNVEVRAGGKTAKGGGHSKKSATLSAAEELLRKIL